MQLVQPRGFRTLYDGGRDFDGVFEWTPRASRPKTDAAQLTMVQHQNCEFCSDEREVCVVNDNAGQRFLFEKLQQGETWVTRAAVDQINAQRIEQRLPPVSVRYASNIPPADRVLGSIKRTDLLVVGLRYVPHGVDLDPRRVEGRAALYSFGFLLRRAAAVLLDINEWELRVGLRVVRDRAGQRRWASISFGRIGERCGLLLAIRCACGIGTTAPVRIRSNQFILRPIVAANHADRCQTLCPDCLRDYSNLAWHNILDWRMAIDLARLAIDADSPVDFTTANGNRWLRSRHHPISALGWTPTMLGSLPAARSGAEAEFIVHPLWADQHPAILQARERLRLLELCSLERKLYSSFFDGRFDFGVTQKGTRNTCQSSPALTASLVASAGRDGCRRPLFSCRSIPRNLFSCGHGDDFATGNDRCTRYYMLDGLGQFYRLLHRLGWSTLPGTGRSSSPRLIRRLWRGGNAAGWLALFSRMANRRPRHPCHAVLQFRKVGEVRLCV